MLAEADGVALLGDEDELVVATGDAHIDELVAFVQVDGLDAVVACMLVFGDVRLLDHAAGSDAGEIAFHIVVTPWQHSGDLFALAELEQIDHRGASAAAAAFWDLEGFQAQHPALIGEEVHHMVGGGDEDVFNEIIFLHLCRVDAASAALLLAVAVHRHALDVASVADGDDHVFFGDEVFDVDIVLRKGDLRAAGVAVFVGDLRKLVAHNLHDLVLIGENGLVFGNAAMQIGQFFLELFDIQTLQAAQLHLDDSLCLAVGKAEAFAEAFLGFVVVVGRTDDGDDLVDVVDGDLQAFHNVRALFGFAQIVAGTTHDDVFLMIEIEHHDLTQGENAWHTVHQCEVDDIEIILQRRVLEKLIQHDLRIHIAAHLDDNADAFAVGFVAQRRDAVDRLFFDKIGDLGDETRLVDLIWDLSDNDAALAVGHFFNGGACAHSDSAATSHVGIAHTAEPHDDAACWEIRRFDDVAKLFIADRWIVDKRDDPIGDFAQIVRRHVRRHPDSDPRGAVDEQVWKTRRQHDRLFRRFVVGRHIVDGLFFNIAQHLLRQLRHARLGVTLRSRFVAVDVPEVPLAVDQRIAHAEILRQTHHRIVHGIVAVWMVVRQHIPDNVGGFFVRTIRRHIGFIHRIEDAAMDRLETVAHIRQRTAGDDAHRIINEGFLHLIDNVAVFNGTVCIGVVHKRPP